MRIEAILSTLDRAIDTAKTDEDYAAVMAGLSASLSRSARSTVPDRTPFPGKCPACSFALRVIPVPGDLGANPPRKRAYVVACSDNPRGCPHPSESLGEVVKRRFVQRGLAS